MSGKKRQCADTSGAAGAASSLDYALQLIGSLPVPTVRNILARAAHEHRDVVVKIVNEQQKFIAAEQAQTIDFDSYSKRAWEAMNVGHSRLSGSDQYEKAFEVASENQGYIDTIGKATKKHSNFRTKKSALETLRKIGKSISLSTDILGSEVRVQFQSDNCLDKTMLQIAKSLTVEERKTFMTQESQEKLVELEELSAGYCLFEKLKDVRLVLLGAKKSGDSGTEEDEEDDQYDDEDDEDDG